MVWCRKREKKYNHGKLKEVSSFPKSGNDLAMDKQGLVSDKTAVGNEKSIRFQGFNMNGNTVRVKDKKLS